MAAGNFTSLTVAGAQAGALCSFTQQASTGHTLTANLQAAGGTSQAAINAVSSNPAFSAVEITGCETGHGTVKIAHVGYADGSDANAAAISIDLKTTTGGTTGTKAQGIFLTSTTDTLPYGDLLKLRVNASDYFIVKGADCYSLAGKGMVGINVPVGHQPNGMLEIVQKPDGTPALALTSNGQTVTLTVSAAGNLEITTTTGTTTL